MSDFTGVSQSGFTFTVPAYSAGTIRRLLPLLIGVALVGGVCALTVILGLLTGVFGTG